MLDSAMSAAWRAAGDELCIRVVAPYFLKLPDGSTVVVEAFVPDFGGPNGAIVVAYSDPERRELANLSEHYVSMLVDGYHRFDKDLFQDTLNDWGWFGDGNAHPDWYTGKPWT